MLRCAASLVVATYAKVRLTPRDLRALPLKLFARSLNNGDFMKSYIQISTTTETKEQAQKIAQYLVETKLAACVQITGPITKHLPLEGQSGKCARVAVPD